jgi:lysozyme family protein
MSDLASLRARNAARWQNAKLIRGSEFGSVAARLAAPVAKARYQAIEAKTGVPWFVIAVTHERESSQDWSRSLAQGDPWNRTSTHVPKGRGPFASFEDAAVDALKNCAPYAARNTDWSVGGLLTMLEQYNGLGYFNRGTPSPYIWSGTDQYVKGKYVADGKFDPNVVDRQLGCAGLILAMMQIDSRISFGGNPAALAPVKPSAPTDSPSITNPASGRLGALLASLFASIFKRAA